ncbi:MAG TPA: sigma-70 family RNA polymerase sigma factor, partial [Tepidisphaeraceae bacterium]|nr:sigma-70 family RNA polymerase sigma factor [Tepidisphaeraceae bacterium]
MTPPPFQAESVGHGASSYRETSAGVTARGSFDADARADGHAGDMRLLRKYVDHGSQAAFADLTAKHLPWVYAMCRRALRDKHLAEDASQAVFVLLARRAATLSDQTRVAGWLFNTTRFVLKDVRKSEGRFQRRQSVAREQARERMVDPGPVDPADRIDPRLQQALDDGLAHLAERDRQALMMHFYEALTLPQMADRLGITRDGAKKRVGRALARLRQLLGTKKKTGLSIAALALLLRGRDTLAALPPDLYASTVAAGTVPGAAPALVEQILAGVAKAMAAASHKLLRAVLLGQAVVAVGVLVVALTRPAEPMTTATRGGAVNRTTASLAGAPSTGPRVTDAAISHSAQSAPTPGKAGADRDPFELPYRSGADEPDPELRKTPEESPKQAEAPPRLLSTTGDGVGGASTGNTSASAGGSTYAGLPPVARAPLAPAPTAVNESRALAPASYRPVTILGTTARAARPAPPRDDEAPRRPTTTGERPPALQSADAADFLAFCRKPLPPLPGDRRPAEFAHTGSHGPDTAPPPVFGYVSPPPPGVAGEGWVSVHPPGVTGAHQVYHDGQRARPAYAIAIRDGRGRGAFVIRDFDSSFDSGDFDDADCPNPVAIAAGWSDSTSAAGNKIIGGRRARRADRGAMFASANAIIARPAAARPHAYDDAADVLAPIAIATPIVFDPPALALPIASLDTSVAVTPVATPEP